MSYPYNIIQMKKMFDDVIKNIETTLFLIDSDIKMIKQRIDNVYYVYLRTKHDYFDITMDLDSKHITIKTHFGNTTQENIKSIYCKNNCQPKYITPFGNCFNLLHHFKFSKVNCNRIFITFGLFVKFYRSSTFRVC